MSPANFFFELTKNSVKLPLLHRFSSIKIILNVFFESILRYLDVGSNF